MAQEMNFDAVVAAPPYYGAFGEEACINTLKPLQKEVGYP